MQIPLFETEDFYGRYEFSSPYLLSVSDCESVTIGELLELGGKSLEAFARTKLHYTDSRGEPALRELIARGYESVSPGEVLELNAPIEGIFITMSALLDPGDRAVVLGPCYDALRNLPEHVSGNVALWMLEPNEGGWSLDLERLDQLLAPPTKLLVVNFPHNPTGFLPTPEQWSELIDRARQRGVWLFSDEMYRGLELGGREALPSSADLYDKSVVLSGLSKSFGLPGLRFGWLVVRDETLREDLLNWKYYTSICPPAPSEQLAMAALEARDTLVAQNRARVERNLALAEPFFARFVSFFDWRAPQAGPVALVGIDVPSARAHCDALAKDAGIVLLPGSFLGFGDRHVRFGFGRDGFAEALARYEQQLSP